MRKEAATLAPKETSGARSNQLPAPQLLSSRRSLRLIPAFRPLRFFDFFFFPAGPPARDPSSPLPSYA